MVGSQQLLVQPVFPVPQGPELTVSCRVSEGDDVPVKRDTVILIDYDLQDGFRGDERGQFTYFVIMVRRVFLRRRFQMEGLSLTPFFGIIGVIAAFFLIMFFTTRRYNKRHPPMLHW